VVPEHKKPVKKKDSQRVNGEGKSCKLPAIQDCRGFAGILLSTFTFKNRVKARYGFSIFTIVNTAS
jgi:hypothetical protein